MDSGTNNSFPDNTYPTSFLHGWQPCQAIRLSDTSMGVSTLGEYGLLINFFLHYLQISEKGSSNLKLPCACNIIMQLLSSIYLIDV